MYNSQIYCQYCNNLCKDKFYKTPNDKICCEECAKKIQRGDLNLDPNKIILSKNEYEVKKDG